MYMSTHQLTRSETDRRIAGVCGGIAQYYDVDPILVRVAFIVAAFMWFGVVLYVVLWIVMPRGAPGVPVYGPRHSSTALQIVESRFARGEISAQELAQIRQDLTGGA